MRVIWLAEVPWEGLRQRHHQLVRRLPADWPVLFVEPLLPRDVLDLLQPPRQWRNVTIVGAAPLVNLRPPAARRLLAWPAARHAAGGLAGRLLQRQVRRFTRGGPYALVTSNVHLAPALRGLRPCRLLYDCSDTPMGFPDAAPWTAAYYRQTVQQADVVLASSGALLALAQAAGARRSVLLGNGVDLAHYARPQPEPPELRALPRPIVGYIGHAGAWFDAVALAAAAAALPHVSFVLVGSVDLSPGDRALLARPNVHLVGPRPYEALPAYVQRFAVGLIPFRRTALTGAVNPNKLYEYAACNLPVVATPFSAEVAAQGPPVTLAEDPAAFAAAVAARLANPGPPTRPLAAAHSWDAAAASLLGLLAGA
jgi:glycosyltransferase involved in cell wall biosynthesis